MKPAVEFLQWLREEITFYLFGIDDTDLDIETMPQFDDRADNKRVLNVATL